MKYYIIAGEASGDLYGSRLITALQSLDADAKFRFWGGPKMQAVSTGQLKSIKETSFMGFLEVAANAFVIRDLFKFAKYSIKEWNPDVIIFIDYPGFNLRMCKWAKLQGYRTIFYISPQLWAWKENRHKLLRDYVDQFFVILPFERDFYRNLDTPCIYHGHPLIEHIPQQRNSTEKIKTIGLFPGSRKQEIKKHLPIMVEYAMAHSDNTFIIAGLSHIKKEIYLEHIHEYAGHLDIRYDSSYEVMQEVDIAIASSGTTTLELALFGVPQIVVYRTSNLSFAIGKRLVKTDYISLVNLIAQKEVVTELLQDAFNVLALEEAIIELSEPERLSEMHLSYVKIREDLGDGQTSISIAKDIYRKLS